MTLPADLSHEVPVGDRGIALDFGATDPQAAKTATAAPLPGNGLFYANAAEATDISLAPISPGIEATYQLRAPESPERLAIGLTLPAVASLGGAVDGGAQVVEGASQWRPSTGRWRSTPTASRSR